LNRISDSSMKEPVSCSFGFARDRDEKCLVRDWAYRRRARLASQMASRARCFFRGRCALCGKTQARWSSFDRANHAWRPGVDEPHESQDSRHPRGSCRTWSPIRRGGA